MPPRPVGLHGGVTPPPDVVIAIDELSSGFTHGMWDGDHLVRLGLEARGLQVAARRWDRWDDAAPGALVVLRSTWDYAGRVDEFRAWLDRLDADGAAVRNPTDLVRWNLHKSYLLHLERRGVPVVPTRLVERGAAVALGDVAAEAGWDDVVVKPAVAATARLTVHEAREGAGATARHFADLVAAEDVLVQPFLPAVVDEGEVSVVAIGGEPTHAVRKRAKPGDWRVQINFGGTDERIVLDDELLAVAARALGALDAPPAYARVDVARHEGRYHLMELELIEPELFFDHAPEAADRLAALLAAEVG